MDLDSEAGLPRWTDRVHDSWLHQQDLRQFFTDAIADDADCGWICTSASECLFVRRRLQHVDLLIFESPDLSDQILSQISREQLANPHFQFEIAIANRIFITSIKRLNSTKARTAGVETLTSAIQTNIASGAKLSVTVTAIDADHFYEPHRKRQFWFGGVIALASMIALGGYKALSVGFKRQLQLSAQKSDFVSSVSHELRAPIASMRLMTESLEKGTVDSPEKQREYFGFILQECQRLGSLVENVLDFSRIEQDRKNYEFEPTDLTKLVASTVKLMTPQAQQENLTLKTSLPEQGDVVVAITPDIDGPAIQRALVNLIDNAIKFSPPKSTIEVGLENGVDSPADAGRPIRIWVQDQGPGVRPEETARIFERFYRSESELRRETRGVGIGLSLVKHIVEAHDGRVSVLSAPNQGSRFTVELPCSVVSGQWSVVGSQ